MPQSPARYPRTIPQASLKALRPARPDAPLRDPPRFLSRPSPVPMSSLVRTNRPRSRSGQDQYPSGPQIREHGAKILQSRADKRSAQRHFKLCGASSGVLIGRSLADAAQVWQTHHRAAGQQVSDFSAAVKQEPTFPTLRNPNNERQSSGAVGRLQYEQRNLNPVLHMNRNGLHDTPRDCLLPCGLRERGRNRVNRAQDGFEALPETYSATAPAARIIEIANRHVPRDFMQSLSYKSSSHARRNAEQIGVRPAPLFLLQARRFTDGVVGQFRIRQRARVFLRGRRDLEPPFEQRKQLFALGRTDAETVLDPFHTEPDQPESLRSGEILLCAIEAPHAL